MRAYACLSKHRFGADTHALIAVQDEHIEPIRRWRNAQMSVLRQAAPLTVEQQSAYYAERIWPAMASPMPTDILLALLERDELVGYGGLVHIAWAHRRAELSFLTDPRFAPDQRAYAALFARFLELIKQVAFGALGLNRLFTETYAPRTHHMAVLESNGFRLEGRMRQHVVVEGARVDSLLHGCLSDERTAV